MVRDRLGGIAPGDVSFEPACYVQGTRIATEHGEAAVESLHVGDRVRTVSGALAPICWIGRRHIAATRHPRPHEVWPVRVRAGAFGRAMPRRDLWLSPAHAVFVGGVLIPIKYLANRTVIAQVPVDEVTYYHIELAQHDVLLAEDLPCESYLDTDGRANFANDTGAMRLFPDFATPAIHASTIWEAQGYAPLVVCGSQMDAARTIVNRLATIATATSAVA